MIIIKNQASIRKMEEAGKRLRVIFARMGELVVSGKTTGELDAWIGQQLSTAEMTSKMKGYMGYRHVSCISVNDEVVHGVPSDDTVLAEGDLVKVDVCASWGGYCADMARTFCIGQANPEQRRLIVAAQKALQKGIDRARPGARLSDISAAVQQEVEKHGYGVVRDFAGHGIGKQMHEEPEVLNYGSPGEGPVLRAGMAFAIEPMITMGAYDVHVTDDGWTVKTNDKSLSVHVEDTVVITEDGPRVMTAGSTSSAGVSGGQ